MSSETSTKLCYLPWLLGNLPSRTILFSMPGAPSWSVQGDSFESIWTEFTIRDLSPYLRVLLGGWTLGLVLPIVCHNGSSSESTKFATRCLIRADTWGGFSLCFVGRLNVCRLWRLTRISIWVRFILENMETTGLQAQIDIYLIGRSSSLLCVYLA